MRKTLFVRRQAVRSWRLYPTQVIEIVVRDMCDSCDSGSSQRERSGEGWQQSRPIANHAELFGRQVPFAVLCDNIITIRVKKVVYVVRRLFEALLRDRGTLFGGETVTALGRFCEHNWEHVRR
jgi:hypothetical protein